MLVSKGTIQQMKMFNGNSKLRKAALCLLVKIVDTKEISHLREEFEKIDTDKSGLLDADEIRQAVRQSKFKISKREVEELIDNIDNNDNTQIDYTEFIASTMDVKKILTEEKIHAIFDCFDVDHTG